MRVFLLGALLLLVVPSAQGKIYKWTDRKGTVHYTDNILVIPAEYRNQIGERASRPLSQQPDLKTTHSPLSSGSSHSALPVQAYSVPLQRDGDSALVDVLFNGTLEMRMVVDTEASLTIISTSAAKQLGLSLVDTPVVLVPSDTYIRRGIGWSTAPLVQVKSITVGGATMRDVEVIVYDIEREAQRGLLGRSFLDEFQVVLDTVRGTVTLSPLTGMLGESLYGGRPEVWWRRKFRYYRRHIEAVEAYLVQRRSGLAKMGIKNPSQSKLARTLRYYQGELATLDHEASLASVPRRWRYEDR